MMSEQRCGTCKWFVPMPEHLLYIGKSGTCAFPLPAWLNAYLSWSVEGLRMKEITGQGFADCPTYEAQP